MMRRELRSGAESGRPRVAATRLPVTGPALFGREADLAWLDACWADGVHVASIVAWGGVGKTALVGTWRNRLRDAGWGGAVRVFDWSFYSQGASEKRVTSADEFVNAALLWFGDPDPTAGSPWDKGNRLAELVRSTPTLLILDGMEPLQRAPGPQEGIIHDAALQALVRGLAGENAGLCVITTRIEVSDLTSLAGEKVRERRLEHLSAEAGTELLRQRGARGTEQELREAAEEYKGHCLALTLLGSYLEEVCEGDIRKRNEIGPLEKDDRLGGHAQRVMAAYARMFKGQPEIAILRLLGLFDRPATAIEVAVLTKELPVILGLTEALERIGIPRWYKALARLRRLGLLAPAADPDQDGTLDSHPLVREHFGEQLRQEQPEAWREGHRRLYEHLKSTAKPLPGTIEEMVPLYAAVVHGCKAGKHKEAFAVYIQRIQRMNEWFSVRKLGAFGSDIAVLSAFFDPPWERLAPGLSEPDEQAHVSATAGFALQAVGRLSEAAELMAMGLKSNLDRGDWVNVAAQSVNLSHLFAIRGDLGQALEHARTAFAFAYRSGSSHILVLSTTTVAAALHQMGQRADAAAEFEEAERLHAQLEPAHPVLYSFSGSQSWELLLDDGREDEVVERATQTLRWVQAQHWLLDIALNHLSLGRAYLLRVQRGMKDDLALSASHLEHAVGGLRRAGYQQHLAHGLLARADFHIHTRAFVAARRDIDEALSASMRCGFRLLEADAHLAYARLDLAETDRTPAREHLAQARSIINQTGYHRRDQELGRLEAAARDQLLCSLCTLTESQVETLLFNLEFPPAYLQERSAPPDARVTELLRWAEQQGLLAEIERIYIEVTGRATQACSAPPAAATTVETVVVAASPLAPAIAPEPAFLFPPPLLEAYRRNKLAVLFGSGLSMAKDVAGNFPRWNELPERLLDQAEKQGVWSQIQIEAKRKFFRGGHLPLEGMLSELDSLKTALRGARKYQVVLNDIFRPRTAAPGEVHRALVSVGVDVLATTNYDSLLEHVESPPVRAVYTWKDSDKALSDIEDGRKVLFKIHGTAENEDTVVMTRAEYAQAAALVPYQRAMSFLLQSYTFLLVGYGVNDPLDLDLVFGLNASAFGSAARTHYALVKDASANDRDRWQRELNIQVVSYPDHGDLPGILRALRAAKP
ncbi:SIR2 family protein [Sorangium sp. So ce233]|uniref:SIR2 family protein n=1 Tax=Sorangium sp. So ce233 TaxID=3133290 RepID=UPI003F63D018